MPAVFAALTVSALVGLLVAERRRSTLRWVAKPLASAGFVGLAISLDALDTPYGRWILAGLLLGWIGDVALLGASRSMFSAGLVAFLAGHVAYVVAFAGRGLSAWAASVSGVAALAAAVAVLRWLRSHLPGEMAGPVLAYLVVISAMLVTAVGATAAGSTVLIAAGAAAFYVSDLFVARDRFVTPGFTNRLWGLPLYYLGQVLLAWSVGV